MPESKGRRVFITTTAVGLAAGPVLTAAPQDQVAAETAAVAGETKAAIDKAVGECRQQAETEKLEAQAAYGKALIARFGNGVVDVIRDTTVARAKGWLEADSVEKRDLSAVKAFWARIGPPFEWRLVEESPTFLRYEVKRCPLAEAMRRHGAPELGFAYNCAYDIGFCQGLNPAIRFTRTKTLMAGDEQCNHSYELVAAPAPRQG